eukprot:2164130-Amphidinium_carterae.1
MTQAQPPHCRLDQPYTNAWTHEIPKSDSNGKRTKTNLKERFPNQCGFCFADHTTTCGTETT